MLFQGPIQRNVICFFFCFPSLCLFFVCYACHSSVLFLRWRTSNSSQPISQHEERRERERDKKSMLPANSLTYLFRFPICSLVWRGSIRLVDELSINVCTSLCSEELSQGKFFSKFHFNKIFSGFCLNYTIHDNRRT